MKIVVVSIIRNEEKIIPHFLKHYSQIADLIVLVDNHSTDRTIEIALELSKKHNIQLGLLKTEHPGYSETIRKNIFDNFYKQSWIREEYDIVIIADADELLYHPRGTRQEIEKLYNIHKNKTVIKPHGYQMFSDTFPTESDKSIIEQVNTGHRYEGLDKICCFSSKLNINSGFGMHVSWFFDENNNEIIEIPNQGFLLLHYKFLGFDHRLERVKALRDNLSALGSLELEHGINVQLKATEEVLRKEYENTKNFSHVLNYEELGYEDI